MKRKIIYALIVVTALLMVLFSGVAVYAEGAEPPSSPPWAYIDLTQILMAVLSLVATIITARVVPWIKARTNQQQQDLLTSTVRILVYAAEQIYGAGGGSEKLKYVETELRVRGYKIDMAAIEAAVREMNVGSLVIAEGVEVIGE